ncbi:MAG TPA: ABC transporter ATP-binding protein [Gaiellaceae bacterium]|nr:ABC transporter ATP-binding protein [Gaiellaceae bacterium]
MADAPAIHMHALSKTYASGVRALVDVDLHVERGEVFGYLGPNGAGKSTTIRLLLDLIRPTAGRAEILGRDTRAQTVEARRRVGYVPGDLRLPDRLTGEEQLSSLARLRGAFDPGLRADLVERFQCVLDRPIRELSRGNRQKLGIVQAFMHRPDVLILDEPTGGLDPLNQEEFRKLARETAAEGRTVFLSSHSLEEVQRIADRVGIIRSGRLIDVDSVASLRERSLRRVVIRFATPVDPSAFTGPDGVRVQSVEDATVHLAAPEAAMDGIVKAAARHPVADFVSEPADLEEIFLELYREDDGRG